jgi:hypothetical protein
VFDGQKFSSEIPTINNETFVRTKFHLNSQLRKKFRATARPTVPANTSAANILNIFWRFLFGPRTTFSFNKFNFTLDKFPSGKTSACQMDDRKASDHESINRWGNQKGRDRSLIDAGTLKNGFIHTRHHSSEV